MRLSDCPQGIPMIMVDPGCEAKFQCRISELGLRHGTRFTVMQKGAFGGLVLNVNGSRYAVDYAFARQAQVRPCLKYARTQSEAAYEEARKIAVQMGELPADSRLVNEKETPDNTETQRIALSESRSETTW